MNRLIFLLVLIVISFVSCTKWQHQYPEDTQETKDTPTERLTNKWWTLHNASVNGIDYTDSVYQMFGKYQIYFSQSLFQTSLNGIDSYYGTVYTGNEPKFTSVWAFINKESSIGIGALMGNNSSETNIVPCYLCSSCFSKYEYLILKLNNSEFKISITTKNNDSTMTNYFISR